MLNVYRTRSIASALSLLFVLAAQGPVASAQDNLKISGEVFADYLYVFSGLDSENDGENRFTYRRARLTADSKLSDQFSARFRIEANDLVGTANGAPTPFVKDLYLKWDSALGKGHDIVIGVQPPPAWQASEKFWGYRSISKTLNDRIGLFSSRDMGVSVGGPLLASGKVRYGAMLGNANSIRAENNKYKRVYGLLEFFPSNKFSATIGSNYQLAEGGYAWNVNGFAGFRSARFRLGVEAFFQRIDVSNFAEVQDGAGIAGMLVVDVFEKNSIMARVAYVERPEEDILTSSLFAVAGFAFKPHANVQFIPNIILIDLEGADNLNVTGRMTLWLKF